MKKNTKGYESDESIIILLGAAGVSVYARATFVLCYLQNDKPRVVFFRFLANKFDTL
jgi:hypothetical protein